MTRKPELKSTSLLRVVGRITVLRLDDFGGARVPHTSVSRITVLRFGVEDLHRIEVVVSILDPAF